MTCYRGKDPETGKDYIMSAENTTLVIIWDGETGKQFKKVRVYKARGLSWGLNEKSLSCSSGQAAQIVNYFRDKNERADQTFRHFTKEAER